MFSKTYSRMKDDAGASQEGTKETAARIAARIAARRKNWKFVGSCMMKVG
jgi:hypothetical protein